MCPKVWKSEYLEAAKNFFPPRKQKKKWLVCLKKSGKNRISFVVRSVHLVANHQSGFPAGVLKFVQVGQNDMATYTISTFQRMELLQYI